MHPLSLVYRAAQHAARAATPVLAGGSSKLARGLAGRRDAHLRLAAWGSEHRDPARPGIWLHAPSVGEGLQARAVLEAMRAKQPSLQAAFTHFSPSAESLARAMPADVSGYLPWDLPGTVEPALAAVRPGALVFTKTEAWPVLVERATARGVPVALIGAAVPAGAGRLRRPARALLRPMWARLSLAAAIAEEDAEGLRALGVPPDAIRVTGDPGIDSALSRARAADPEAPWLAPFRETSRPTVVAGSTWPADEAVLLPALDEVRRTLGGVRVVLAPHEPSPARVEELRRAFVQRGWTVETLSEVERDGRTEAGAVVVDRVGVLAQLYTVGWAAYVGGGFHGHGLHSVLEPAAARLPVVFGPAHHNARAAGDLLACGGAALVDDAAALGRILHEWLAGEVAGDYVGTRAFDYIHGHLGAAERTASLLFELLRT